MHGVAKVGAAPCTRSSPGLYTMFTTVNTVCIGCIRYREPPTCHFWEDSMFRFTYPIGKSYDFPFNIEKIKKHLVYVSCTYIKTLKGAKG